MLIVETVPLAITEGSDAGVVVATRSAPRMDHDGEQLKGQQTLRKHRRENLIVQIKAAAKLYFVGAQHAGSLMLATRTSTCNAKISAQDVLYLQRYSHV